MNFSDIRNHLYDESEKYWWFTLFLGILVQIIALLSLIIKNNSFLIIAGAVTLFIPMIARWLQEISIDKASCALKCRLAILYSDAFGEKIPDQISKDIRAMVKGEKVKSAPFIKPYYDSKLSPGPTRLAEIVSESAFWTYKLAQKIMTIMIIYTGIYLLIGLILAYFIFQLNVNSMLTINIAKSLVVYMSFIFTSESTLLIKKYNDMRHKAEQIFKDTDRMSKVKKLSTVQIMQVVEEYNLLLINSPPIPSIIYNLNKSTLNDAYKNSLEVE